jgi:YD repeat-containing protein
MIFCATKNDFLWHNNHWRSDMNAFTPTKAENINEALTKLVEAQATTLELDRTKLHRLIAQTRATQIQAPMVPSMADYFDNLVNEVFAAAALARANGSL